MTDRYAVFGNPVEHSLSPRIHSAFAKQFGEDIQYDKILVEEGRFAEAAQQFFGGGGCGLNITAPFKGDAYEFVENNPFGLAGKCSERARLAKAVNTLWIEDGKVRGDNTDGIGLVRDLTNNLGWKIKNKHVLVIGAGGAVRGVMAPLLQQKPSRLVVINRTEDKAIKLEKDFLKFGPIKGGGYELGEMPNDRQFDLVINGTSASLTGDLPPLSPALLAKDAGCYDMVYGKATAFMQWATENGIEKVTDGLGMLVEQAAESFCIWRGNNPEKRPDTAPVLKGLRAVNTTRPGG